jgi:hypothetical protein
MVPGKPTPHAFDVAVSDLTALQQRPERLLDSRNDDVRLPLRMGAGLTAGEDPAVGIHDPRGDLGAADVNAYRISVGFVPGLHVL